jgi:membrane peptidoglycan carboxypeptidase
VSILEVKDKDGNVLDKPNAPGAKQVISAQEAYLITFILRDYSSQWNLGWNKPFAGKSGTTNNYRDAWMMAYSPNLVIGAWVGHTADSGNQDMNGVYGSMVGSSVLKDFINNGLTQAHFTVETFKRPDGLIDGPPCATTATASPSASPSPSPSPTPSSSNSEKELYLPGTECKPEPTPSPTPSPSPSDALSPLPSILPSGIFGSPSPSPTPTPRPTPTPTPAATPTPSH